MTEDIADSWEELANGEELDKKLDKLVLPAVKDVKDSSKNSAPVPPRLVEDTTASRPTPSQPTVRILKRESTNNTQNNCASADRQQRPIRTLEEREAAYAEARLRILGAACSPEDELEAKALVEASAAKELLKSAESAGKESTGPSECTGKESTRPTETAGPTESAGNKSAGSTESAAKESAVSAGKESAKSNGSTDKKLAESVESAGKESAGSLKHIAKESTGSTELILESSASSTDQSLEPTKDSSANR